MLPEGSCIWGGILTVIPKVVASGGGTLSVLPEGSCIGGGTSYCYLKVVR